MTHAPSPCAITALLAATLAALVQPIFRFSDCQALLYVLPVAGDVTFSGAGQYNTL
jgi:hypothetical protein